MKDAAWLSPADYAVHSTQPGGPSSPANLSLEKRALQLLSGEDVAMCLMESLLHSADSTPKPILSKRSDVVVVLHWSPYEGGLETAVCRANLRGPMAWKSCSLSMNAEHAKLCEARMAKHLLLDWKSNNFQLMVKPQLLFQADLPEQEAAKYEADPLQGLQMLQFEGGRPQIPSSVRRKWSSDVVYSADWMQELKKCDELLTSPEAASLTGGSAVSAAEPGEGQGSDLPEQWQVKGKEALPTIAHTCTCDIANLCLHVVQSETEENAMIYLEAKEGMTVPSNKALFKMGQCEWFKPPKSTRLLNNESERCLHIFEVRSDLVPATYHKPLFNLFCICFKDLFTQ